MGVKDIEVEVNLPDGRDIKDVSWKELQQVRDQIDGWVYPRRNISPFIPWFPRSQQIALYLYGWIAMLILPAGLVLPFVLNSWWWALLVPGAFVVWKANRKSMEQFFLQNLKDNENFYEEIRKTEMGKMVKVVIK